MAAKGKESFIIATILTFLEKKTDKYNKTERPDKTEYREADEKAQRQKLRGFYR
jgi:hypothetical protein